MDGLVKKMEKFLNDETLVVLGRMSCAADASVGYPRAILI